MTEQTEDYVPIYFTNEEIDRVFDLFEWANGIWNGSGLKIPNPNRDGGADRFAMEDDAALETWYKLLEIYPSNANAQQKVIELEEKRAGKRA